MEFNIKNIYKGNINEVKDIFNSKEFNERYTSNLELGAIYSKEKTTFRVWSPAATKVAIELFNKNDRNEFNKLEELEMKEENNVWTVEGEAKELSGGFPSLSAQSLFRPKQARRPSRRLVKCAIRMQNCTPQALQT